jgi:alkyldihydroxyacetonephosphate synthase
VRLPRGYRFPTLHAALEAMRHAFRAGLRPSVLRLYDPFDTMIAMRGHDRDGDEAEERVPAGEAPAGVGGRLRALARRRAAQLQGLATRTALGRPRGLNRAASALKACLLVVVHEGPKALAELEADRFRGIAAASAGRDLGEGPGRHWLKKRYAVSYKMPPMFDAGGWVDTFEVATTWGKVEALYEDVRRALAPHAFVMAHFSHAYADGCSIYFTFAGSAADPRRGLATYEAAWAAALEAADRAGATLTHHHGVGLLKAPFLARELGEGGTKLLRAAKAACDPAGILNPGKLGL